MHKHLTWTDRLKIEACIKKHLPPREISKCIHVHPSTIYREIIRGSYMHLKTDLTMERRYSAEVAERKYRENLSGKGANLKIGNDIELANYIERKILNDKYSPAAVCAEIRLKNLTFKTQISEKTIYNYIRKGVFLHLTIENLPERGKRKRKYNKVVKKASRASKGESIERRPEEILQRNTFGHWEMDCVEGKKETKKTLLVLSERLTRQEMILPMKDQTAASVVSALNKLERRYGKNFPKIFKSITVDNGSEFSNCKGMEQSIDKKSKRTIIYYCHPYCAFERGTNENINKMIRRFLPKGTDFKTMKKSYFGFIEQWINNYPRKLLNGNTSQNLFEKYMAFVE